MNGGGTSTTTLSDRDADDRKDVLVRDGEQRTVGVVLSRAWGETTTLTLLWEHVKADVYAKASGTTRETTANPVTFQIQYGF
ncbi:MAG: hypothetical protein ACT4PE_14140 [Candidatus Eiseniibacteriota bacterium]